ncbi:hypothetical protein C2W62_15220 [Candidatus Entotheonella serta]|nr:hypothetical protein C2W62_15220 [Candidatus Entotheonella serta]
MRFQGIKVLVTGASGFIGSRLAERLVTEGAEVHVLLRNDAQAEPLHRLGCRSFLGDIAISDSLLPAVNDCKYIFHCAGDRGGNSLDVSRAINVKGTLNLLAAASLAQVKRMVHVSSVAVHGHPLPPLVTEELPLQNKGGTYTISKTEGEQAALNFARTHDTQVVVVRPTLVYGPGSSDWVLRPFSHVKEETIALIDGGVGLANLIYIDDLLEGLLLSAQAPNAAGEAFLLSGQQPVTWRDYLGAFVRCAINRYRLQYRCGEHAAASYGHKCFSASPAGLNPSTYRSLPR